MEESARYLYGVTSRENLDEAHPDLVRVFEEVIKVVDCSILECHRGEKEQNKYYQMGLSKVKYPDGKHNISPNTPALDVAPYPIDWKDHARFYFLAGVVKAIAKGLGVRIRWGGDWDNDNDFSDQQFMDLVHFELIQDEA